MSDLSKIPRTPDGAPPADPAAIQPVGQGEYVVKEGDCISSIAKDTGHFWETIWHEPANAELKAARNDPNVLLTGDRLTIPQRQPKKEAGVTETRHRFVRRGEPSLFRVHIHRNNQPLKNQPFTLTYDGKTISGTTDARGLVECPIPGNARQGHLVVGSGTDQVATDIRFGNLEPIDTVRGVQQRLNSLGFSCGTADGVIGPKTRAALKRFQNRHGITASGESDVPTQNKLREVYGS